MEPTKPGESAFEFHGSWREYAPIAFTNLLLTIVTLGIYRFWATARSRRYLWSRSRFIDARLEWTGTGFELFVGALLVLLLFGGPYLILTFVAQALVLRGYATLGTMLGLLAIFAIFYLYGVARFRALRYRLGRTYWHGIRGGSDSQGFRYGLSAMWKTVVGYVPAGLLIPWSMTSLWNERWDAMSFGSNRFRANADFSALMLRFVLCYILPFVVLIAIVIAGVAVSMSRGSPPPGGAAMVAVIVLVIIGFYLVWGLAFLGFYAKYFRVAVGALHLDTLDFGFGARTADWFKLILGDIGLVVVTLGIGLIFLDYRHWKFFMTHMEAFGEIDLDTLTQSTTARSQHGEGLLDAFDVGAI